MYGCGIMPDKVQHKIIHIPGQRQSCKSAKQYCTEFHARQVRTEKFSPPREAPLPIGAAQRFPRSGVSPC